MEEEQLTALYYSFPDRNYSTGYYSDRVFPNFIYKSLFDCYMDIIRSRNIKLVMFILEKKFYKKRSIYIEKMFCLAVAEAFPELVEYLKFTYDSMYIFDTFTLPDFVKYVKNKYDEFNITGYLHSTNRIDVETILWLKTDLPCTSKIKFLYCISRDKKLLKRIIYSKIKRIMHFRQINYNQFESVIISLSGNEEYFDHMIYELKDLPYIKRPALKIFYDNDSYDVIDDYICNDNIFDRNNYCHCGARDVLNVLRIINRHIQCRLNNKFVISVWNIISAISNKVPYFNKYPEFCCFASHAAQLQIAYKSKNCYYCSRDVCASLRDRANLVYIRSKTSGFDVSEIAKFL